MCIPIVPNQSNVSVVEVNDNASVETPVGPDAVQSEDGPERNDTQGGTRAAKTAKKQKKTSDYEMLRERNIQERLELFANLELEQAKRDCIADVEVQEAPKKRNQRKRKAEEVEPTRVLRRRK